MFKSKRSGSVSHISPLAPPPASTLSPPSNNGMNDFSSLQRVGSAANDSVSSRGEKRRSGFFGLGGKKDKEKEKVPVQNVSARYLFEAMIAEFLTRRQHALRHSLWIDLIRTHHLDLSTVSTLINNLIPLLRVRHQVQAEWEWVYPMGRE
jgi:hypothetical protein